MARTRKFPVGVTRSLKPKFGGNGRTWDTVNVILPNGERIVGHMDYTWGKRFYFEVESKWYSASNLAFDEAGSCGGATYDLNIPRRGL